MYISSSLNHNHFSRPEAIASHTEICAAEELENQETGDLWL